MTDQLNPLTIELSDIVGRINGIVRMLPIMFQSSRRHSLTNNLKEENMIKVTAMYPYSEGKRFDIDYYCKSHIPMVQKALGPALKSVTVDFGMGGGAPGSKPAFVAMAHLIFDSIESFQTSFVPHVPEFSKDGPNYTDIKADVQISEVKM